MGDLSTPEALAPCELLPPELRLRAAALCYAALPAFYEPLDKAHAIRAIASEFSEPNSEMFGAEAALLGGDVAGVIASYPTGELASRQRVSLHHILSSLPSATIGPFVSHVRTFAAGIPVVLAQGRYLARLAVTEEQRGSGLANRLLENFLADAGEHRRACLHVAASNTRAIAFYRRHGFSMEAQGQPYVVMQRT